MRVFVGIPLNGEFQSSLAEQTRNIRKERPEYRWAPTESLHITLVFIGETTDSAVESLGEELRPLGPILRPFRIALNRLGQFPPRGRPRVVYVSIGEGMESCRELYRIVSEAAQDHMKPLKRRYTPHITLARAKPHHSELPKACLGASLSGECSIDRITLFESVLDQSGARYRPVLEVPFSRR